MRLLGENGTIPIILSVPWHWRHGTGLTLDFYFLGDIDVWDTLTAGSVLITWAAILTLLHGMDAFLAVPSLRLVPVTRKLDRWGRDRGGRGTGLRMDDGSGKSDKIRVVGGVAVKDGRVFMARRPEGKVGDLFILSGRRTISA